MAVSKRLETRGKVTPPELSSSVVVVSLLSHLKVLTWPDTNTSRDEYYLQASSTSSVLSRPSG